MGSRVLKSTGAEAIRRGWIEVESDSAAVSGLLTYRQAETGVEVSVKPVQLGTEFALFVEESLAIGAGVAIFKPDAAPNIELRLRDEEGNDPLNGVFIPRGDFRQDTLTLPEWLAVVNTGFLSDFRGLLFIRSEDDSQFAPLGLRFGKTSRSVRLSDAEQSLYTFTSTKGPQEPIRNRLHSFSLVGSGDSNRTIPNSQVG